MLYILYISVNIYNNFYKTFLMFKSGCKLMVLMHSLLTELGGNCRKTDNQLAPQNLPPLSLK